MSGSTQYPWHLETMKVPQVWGLTDGHGVRVGILDGGVLSTPALGHALRGSVRWDGSAAAVSDLEDDEHANKCASLIASANPEAPGIAVNCELLSIIVTSSGEVHPSRVQMAIEHAQKEGCRVLSCSFTLPSVDDDLRKTVERYLDQGGLMVASAGDDTNRPNAFPATFARVVVVGGLTDQLEPLPFAHDRADCMGPATALSVVDSRDEVDLTWSGETSGAAAAIAGVVALMKCRCSALGKNLDAIKAKSLLRRFGTSSLPDVKALIDQIEDLPDYSHGGPG